MFRYDNTKSESAILLRACSAGQLNSMLSAASQPFTRVTCQLHFDLEDAGQMMEFISAQLPGLKYLDVRGVMLKANEWQQLNHWSFMHGFALHTDYPVGELVVDWANQHDQAKELLEFLSSAPQGAPCWRHISALTLRGFGGADDEFEQWMRVGSRVHQLSALRISHY
jgi:hypothetical protein